MYSKFLKITKVLLKEFSLLFIFFLFIQSSSYAQLPKVNFFKEPKIGLYVLFQPNYRAAILTGDYANAPEFNNKLNSFNVKRMRLGVVGKLSPSTSFHLLLFLENSALVKANNLLGLLGLFYLDQMILTGSPSLKFRVGYFDLPYNKLSNWISSRRVFLIDGTEPGNLRSGEDLGFYFNLFNKKKKEFSWGLYLGLVNGERGFKKGDIGNYSSVSQISINRTPMAIFRFEVDPFGKSPAFGREYFMKEKCGEYERPFFLSLGIAGDYSPRVSTKKPLNWFPNEAHHYLHLAADIVMAYDRFYLGAEYLTDWAESYLNPTTGSREHLVPESAIGIQFGFFIIPNVLQLGLQYNRSYKRNSDVVDKIEHSVEGGLIWYITPGSHKYKWIIIDVKDYIGKAHRNITKNATLISTQLQITLFP